MLALAYLLARSLIDCSDCHAFPEQFCPGRLPPGGLRREATAWNYVTRLLLTVKNTCSDRVRS